jgi:hypothetical protein
MIASSIVRRLMLGAATTVALSIAGISVPIVVGPTTAYAQVLPEFQDALDQYGEWRRDPRYGDIWVPTGLSRDWRPYENGHWVYTDDWGWYWVSDPQEEDFGWVTYHYGRWANDRRIGWFWVPGDEWAPAWVDWRYGDGTVGWAPLPPDGYDVEAYEADPVYWVFVPDRYMTAPRLRTYYVPQDRRASFLRSTRIVNRTMATRGVHIAVNPGISPAFVARVTRKALPTYQVRPRVFAATQGVSGAVQVKREDLHRAPGAPGGAPHFKAVSVQRTNTVIKVDAAVTAPKPLAKGESGVLGSHPPRAAQGGVTPQVPASPALQTPAGAPPHTAPMPTVHPDSPAKPEERRDVHPQVTTAPVAPSSQPSQVAPVHPVETHTPPPPPPPAGPKPPLNAQPAQQPHPAPPPPPVVHAPPPPPPPVVHAPPPPVVHAPPPPVVHAPPPPAVVHGPPPAAKPAGPPPKPGEKPGEKPPEPPK